MAKREFYVVIEKGDDGVLIGVVPQLKACHSYGETLDELMANMKEAVLLRLDEKLDVDEVDERMEFVGIQKIEV